MLTKLYDWYRVVDPVPSEEVLEKRKDSIIDFIGVLKDSKNLEVLINCIKVAVNGFDKFNNEDLFVQDLVKNITDHQPSFQTDLSENALQLQIFSCIALGEIIFNTDVKIKISKNVTELASILFLSSIGLKTMDKIYLKSIFFESL